MRKVVFLFLFSLLFSFQGFAQRGLFMHELAVGINGGVNLSKVSFLHNNPAMNVQLGDIGMRAGMRAGLTVRYISQKHFGIQLETNYIQGGWSEKFRSDNGEGIFVNGVNFDGVDISRRVNYLEIPLLAHIYFGNKVRFFVNLGPKLGIIISYKGLKDNLTPEQLSIFNDDDPRIYDDGHNPVDYGLTVGGGFDIQIGRLHSVIEGRYTFGFGDLYSNSKKDIYQRSNNQSLAIMMTFLLPLKTFHRY